MVSWWINQATNNSSRLVDPLRLIPPTLLRKRLPLRPGYPQLLPSLPQHLSGTDHGFLANLMSRQLIKDDLNMPRRPRITLAGVPHHLIQRGNNRQACFFSNDDYQTYLHWLKEYADKHDCAVHAYVLMTNHVHLLITPSTSGAAGQLMKQLGQRYVQYVNRTYRRSGTLWEATFVKIVVQFSTLLRL